MRLAIAKRFDTLASSTSKVGPPVRPPSANTLAKRLRPPGDGLVGSSRWWPPQVIGRRPRTKPPTLEVLGGSGRLPLRPRLLETPRWDPRKWTSTALQTEAPEREAILHPGPPRCPPWAKRRASPACEEAPSSDPTQDRLQLSGWHLPTPAPPLHGGARREPTEGERERGGRKAWGQERPEQALDGARLAADAPGVLAGRGLERPSVDLGERSGRRDAEN
eukprot:15453094-Alexandrium_andersonii.AAC.1